MNLTKTFENPRNPAENVTRSRKKQGHWQGSGRNQAGIRGKAIENPRKTIEKGMKGISKSYTNL